MNLIVYDFPERENDVFAKEIINTTGEDWQILGMPRGQNEPLFIWNLFLNRNKYDKIVFWQQRHGIYYANLCNMFHVKKGPLIYILTFIYKKESGIKGHLKSFLYKGAVKSKNTTRIICYSKFEVDYYNRIFDAPEGKIISTTFGLADQKYRNGASQIENEGYLLDVGRSNRDHAFLEESLKNTPYKAIIADRTYSGKGNDNCVVRQDIKYGEDLYRIIEKCFAVIVPLKDENISAGQTVFIQAMMFAKPIIVTKSNTISEYVYDGENGFVIEKSKDILIQCLNALSSEKELYETMCKRSREIFKKNYSFEALGISVGRIILNSYKEI